jgi:anthranilate phosphoribosyltransferase
MVESIEDGLTRAAVAIDSGTAQQTLQQLVQLSNTSAA